MLCAAGALTAGCGGASEAAAGATTPQAGHHEAASSANGAPVLLRIHPTVGARYQQRTEVVAAVVGQTDTPVVHSELLGELRVTSVRAGSTTFSFRTTSVELSGVPGLSEAPTTEGVEFIYTRDARGARQGDVVARGATSENQIAVSAIATMLQEGLRALPEQPLREGDSWTEHQELTLSLGGAPFPTVCDTTYTVGGTEGVGDAIAVRITLEGGCVSPAASVGSQTFSTTSTTTGTWTVALRDGVSSTMRARTASHVVTQGEDGEEVSLDLENTMTSETRPLAQ